MAKSYKEAGVDIEAGDKLVDWLIESDASGRQSQTQEKSFTTKHNDKVVSGIGGFASLFRAQFTHMKSPCLVSATDGVGTKVKLAAEFERYEGIGQDLVAMCVNDLVCVGAEPLFFLDYYATGKLNLKSAQAFLTSVKSACMKSGCVLIGGETAEMPGVYHGKDFDCAGFAVGVVDELERLGADKVKLGDRLIGVESSGFHSNGYSLLRQVFANDLKEWIDILLKPTHLYPELVLNILNSRQAALHAVAHVTGGGLDNLLRVIPTHTKLNLRPWPVPEIFKEVRKRQAMEWSDILSTLNCGIGLVLFVEPGEYSFVASQVEKQGFKHYDLGVVESSAGKESFWELDFQKL